MFRVLSPWSWGLGLAGVLGAGLIVADALGFRWDPLGLAERRLRAAETAASVAGVEVAARRLEVEAAAEQMRRLDELHHQTVAVGRATARVATQARSAHDAETPLDVGRMARLAAHDRELCRLAPAVCGAAAADPARSGDDALRAGEIAGHPDAGRS